MRITRLSLRNYRVFEDPVDLEMPPGLVGIYGPNGAGKSYLVESILWTLFGRSRTTNADVRTSGVLADCVTEVEFEHEGHLYAVRRTVGGASGHVKAEAHADRRQVAEGVRDTARYVRSVLGMDDAAFRASVFAEQKQIAAFSQRTPSERQKLVLQLLGITAVDKARDDARKDARERLKEHDRLRSMLPDLDAARAAEAAARAAAEEAAGRVEALAVVEQQAADRLARAEEAVTALDGARQEYERLVEEGRTKRAAHAAAAERVAALDAELAALADADAELSRLAPAVAGLPAAEERLRALDALAEAEAAVATLGPPPAPPPHSVDQLTPSSADARRQLDLARTAAAEADGRLSAARAELERAVAAHERSAALSGEADCPLCGQGLGASFEQVRAHRDEELRGASVRVEEAETAAADRRDALARAETAAVAALAALDAARKAEAAFDRTRAAWDAGEQRVAVARSALDPPPEEGERQRLQADVAVRREAADRSLQLRGRLERRDVARQERDREQAMVQTLAGELEALREKVRSLAFDAGALDRARLAHQAARAVHDEARRAAGDARVAAAQARGLAEGAARGRAQAEEQHARLAATEVEARHLARFAELMADFRNRLVGTVGPRLSAQAAELFAELTDHEYDRLEVDPETYEIKIHDAGVAYGMGRFSGSEEDLANLALRVAISEHVRFQSGGQVGLLVLDEVFGPLDGDRKERMLAALQRLQGRFRQVLVVTHDNEVKEQLPHALAVVPRGRRRSTVEFVTL